ncbi:Thiamine import ATP-binding ThiQ [Gossypium arboreum]|uniref:Thiamine import ATP-binding ThiQ n=1 Tax=Gossypium arboreum TaxID=29729 RepID=A0A0B0MLD4_GOSAR|nr:Thiamine import ATP-binding ThiQ [Gossypium arboreum]
MRNGQKQRKWAKVRIQHGLDFLTRARTRPEVIAHGRVTWACPCRAQVESNSEKANFESS